MEEWRTTVENNRYEVSNKGRVRSKITGTILKPIDNGHGYFGVVLYTDDGSPRKRHYIHRIVANAFIPNPENKPNINHKDGVRCNNCVDNLEWVTQAENNLHKYRVLGYQNSEKQREHARKHLKALNADPIQRAKTLEAARQVTIARSYDYNLKNHLHLCKPIYCVEMGKVFISAGRIIRQTGLNGYAVQAKLNKGKDTIFGYTWRYVKHNRLRFK